MLLRWLFASVHLLALGIGLGAVALRGSALRRAADPERLRTALHADTWWGIAAVLWIATGLTRAFGGLEKGTDFYLANPWFHTKMGLLLLILLLEVWPMATLIRWRRARAVGRGVDTSRAGLFATISTVQVALLLAMIFVSTAMARGVGW